MSSELFTYPLHLNAIHIRGVDRKDFLQRQISNDIRLLTPGVLLPAALTSPVARILDVFYLYENSSETISAVSLTGNGEATARFLKSRIFFMDKVSIDNGSAPMAFDALWGEGAAEFASALGFSKLPSEGKIESSGNDENPILLMHQPPGFGLGYLLSYPVEESDRIAAVIDETGVVRVDSREYEILRIEKGIPSPKHELSGEYTPFEINLDAAVSGEKGCYTGQEVLARQVTYDKIVRRMVGIQFEAPVQPGEKVYAGSTPAGVVTSSVESPRYGAISLGILRRPHFEPGTEVTVQSDSDDIRGTVVELPFC